MRAQSWQVATSLCLKIRAFGSEKCDTKLQTTAFWDTAAAQQGITHLRHFLIGAQHDAVLQTGTRISLLDMKPMPSFIIFSPFSCGKGFSSADKTLQCSQERAWDMQICVQGVYKGMMVQPSGLGHGKSMTSIASSNRDIRP